MKSPLLIGLALSCLGICTSRSLASDGGFGLVHFPAEQGSQALDWTGSARFKPVPLAVSVKPLGVSSVSGSVVATTGQPLTVGAYSPAGRYYLEVVTGSAAGKRVDVTGNTENTITVDLSKGDLAGLGSSDTIHIIEKWSLDRLFPGGQRLNSSSPTVVGTEIVFPKSTDTGIDFSAAPVYQYRSDLSRWISAADPATDVGAAFIEPGALMVVRDTAVVAIDHVFSGRVVTGTIPFYVTAEREAVAEIEIKYPADTDLVDGESWLDFGAVSVGGKKDIQIFLHNTGSGVLGPLSAEIVGDSAASFSVGAFGANSLAPGEVTTLNLSVTPNAFGSVQSALQITSNDADEAVFDISLTATGLAADISVQDWVGGALISGEGAMNFDSLLVGGSVIRQMTLRNQGNAVLAISDIAISGDDQSDFVIHSIGSTALAPGGDTTLAIQFSPSAAGDRVASIRFTSNDPDEASFDIGLTGKGTMPMISLEHPHGVALDHDTAKVVFDMVPVSERHEQVVTVKNSGDGLLSNLSVAVENANGVGTFEVKDLAAEEVAPGDSTSFKVLFTPQNSGDGTATVRVLSTDSDRSPFLVRLEGTGTDPEIAIKNASGADLVDGVSVIDLGSINLGGALVGNLTIQNSGNAPLTNLALSITGENAEDFSAESLPVASLQPGTSVGLVINCEPSAVGDRGAVLRVTSNDRDESPFEIQLTAKGTVPEIDVEQPVGSPLESQGEGVDFGSISVSQTAKKVFQIMNSGDGDLEEISITLEGVGKSDFSVDTPVASVLSAGLSASFEVSFTPTASGDRNARMLIASNDSDENPFVVSMTGLGLQAEISVTQAPNRQLIDGESAIEFGESNLGVEANQTVVIRNDGNDDLKGIQLALAGAAVGDFRIDSNVPDKLDPGEMVSVKLTCKPSEPGIREAMLSILSSDSDEGTFELALLANGTQPNIRVEHPLGTPLVNGESGLSFGDLDVLESSELTVSIRNTGDGVLGDLGIKFTGPNRGDFSFTDLSGVGANPGEDLSFKIVFTPQGAGERSAVIEIESNDADDSPFLIYLTGTGLDPEIQVKDPEGVELVSGQSAVSLGSGNLGATVQKQLLIQNIGNAPLWGIQFSLSGDDASDFSVSPLSEASLAPGESVSVPISLTITELGLRSATLEIESNDRDETPFLVPLTGRGTAPDITIQQAAEVDLISGGGGIEFPDTDVLTSASLPFVVRNEGDGLLESIGFSLEGEHSDDFTVRDLTATEIAPGQSGGFVVDFTPTGRGARTALLSIQSNDPDENPFQVALAGLGLDPEISVSHEELGVLVDGSASLDFGQSNVGKAKDLAITISNIGNAPLSDLGMGVLGAASGDFQVADIGVEVLEPGAGLEVSVSMVATEVGRRNAILTIFSDDRDEGEFQVNLTGFATEAQLAVFYPEDNRLENHGDPIDWSGVLVGQSVRKTFVLENVGDGPLEELRFEVAGSESDDFSIVGGPWGAVLPSETVSVTVELSPLAAGSRAAVLEIHSNDRNNTPFLVPFIAHGLQPKIGIEEKDQASLLASNVVQLDDRTASEKVLTLKNLGNVDLSDISGSIVGPDASGFSIAELEVDSLLVGESSDFKILFTATAAGAKSAKLRVRSAETEDNPVELDLMGVVATTINSWAEAHGLMGDDALPTADSDGDGVSLLEEYAYNLDPNLADNRRLESGIGTSGLPQMGLVGDRLQIEYLRRVGDTSIHYIPEFSSEVEEFFPAASSETVSGIDQYWERVTIRDSESTATSDRRFARMRVELSDSL